MFFATRKTAIIPGRIQCLAEMIYESNSGETNISKVYQGLSPRIPLGFLRLWYLRLYLWYANFTDRSKKEI